MATTNSVLNATLSSYQLTAGVPVTLTMTFDQDVLYFDPGAIKASIGKVGEPTYKSKSELKIWTATYTPAAHEISVTHFIRVELSKVHNVRGTEIGNTFVRTAGFTVAPAPLTPTLIPDGPAAPKVTDNQMVLSYVGGAGLDDTASLTTNAGFTVSSASLGSAAISVNSASVNAANKTITLTLSRAVANLEQVRVSYTKPDNGNGVQDKTGRVAANFTDQAVINNTPDTTPPVLITSGANAPKVSGNQLLLSYDEANSLDSGVVLGNAGFTVTSPGSAAIEVNRASVDAASKTVTLMLNRAVGNGEQVSISYDIPPPNIVKPVQDAAGNKAAIFTGQSVINTADTTPPVLITSATAPNVNGDRMVLSYTDVNILDDTALSGNAGFTVTSTSPGSAAISVNGASVNAANKTVTLTLSRPVDNGEQVSLSYTKPTSGNVVKDAAGNAAASFTGQAVNNETPDTTPPVLITTGTSVPKVNGTQLVLSYTEANSLDPAALTGNAGFTVTSASPDSAAISVSSANVNAANKTVTLTLSRAVENLEQVSVSYTKPATGNVVQDAAGNDAANFTDETVNNETPDTTPPALITTGTSVPKVNGTQLVLSYTEANSLDPAALPGNAGFTVTSASPGSTPITVNGASVNAANKTVTLTLSRAVENLEQVSVSYTKPTSGNVVQDAAGNDAANFTNQAVTNATPDTTPPVLIFSFPTTPSIDGNQMVLRYTDVNILDDTALVGSGGFTVTSASFSSTPISVNSASVDAANKTVTLTLSRAAERYERLSVSYTKPTTGNGVQDAAGNAAANFTGVTVHNNSSPPRLNTTGVDAPVVNGRELILYYSFSLGDVKALDPAALTGNAGFTVTSTSPGSTPITVNSASVNAANKTITLTLSRPVENLEQVSVSYTKPTTGNVVQDAFGNKADDFTGQAVNNKTPDTTPPVLIITGNTAPKVNGTQLVLSYTEANSLDPAALTGSAGFTVTSVTGTPITVNSASVNAANKTVTLTLSRAVENLEQVSVSYTKPTTGNVVQDAAGNDAADFTDQTVNNETPDTTPPVLITTGTSAPKVNGNQIVLSYTEANSLDPAALAGSGGFAVSSASFSITPISVNSASVDAANKTVTLTLSRAVENRESVSVGYTKPTTGNGVQDAAGNAAANFTVVTVHNNPPRPPSLIVGGPGAPKVNGRELVLSYYLEANSLDPAALTGNAGFTVTSVTGTPITVNSASVNAANKTITLTLSRAVENLEEVGVSYTKPTTGNVVQDTAGNAAYNFTPHGVINETPDTTPPVLITTGTSPKVNARELVLSYTEANSLDPAALTGSAGFTVTSASPDSAAISVSSASVNAANKTITLTLSRPVANGEQVSVSYTKPTSGNVVQDAAGNDAANFTDQSVNNETPDTTPPALITSGDATPKVNGTQLVLSYTEANSLDPAALTGSAGFTVTSASRGSAAISVSSASVNAANKTVTLTLSRAVENLEQVSVSYTKPTTGNVVQDAAGNDAVNFTNQAVTNATPDTTPPVLLIDNDDPIVSGNLMLLRYTDVNILDDTALAGSGGFTVTSASPGSAAISVNSASVDVANMTVTLTLSRAVEVFERQVSVSYTKPTTGNGVQDAAGNAAANFTGVTVFNNSSPPMLFNTPVVNGRELILYYLLPYIGDHASSGRPPPWPDYLLPHIGDHAALDPAALTGNAGFTVTSASPGSAAITVSSASVISPWAITLMLSRAVENLEQVSVSYTKPTTGNVVQDTVGNKADDFTDQSVNNETPDTTPPALITTGTSAPKVNGTQLVLSYTEANSLDPAALTGNAGFTVTSTSPGSTPITVTSASVNAANKTVTLTLSRPVDNGEQVSVSYAKPGNGNVVQDAAGNDAANFTDQTVNTETPDTTPPALITTGDAAPKVNGTQLVLSYTEANSLNPAALTGNAGFTVTSTSPGSTPITVDSASVNAANKTITLTLSRPVDNGEQVSVSYTKPTSGNVVQDAAGNDAASFTGQAVNSETPDTTPLALITTGTSAPKVNARELVLSYSGANSLDPAALTGDAGFTVTSTSPGSTPITVNSASVDAANKTITLTLSRPVDNGEQVSVSYTKPTSGNVVQDAAGNDAANFTGQAVNSETPDTTPLALITTGTSAPKVNGTQLVLSYSGANSLDPAALTGNAGFTVTSASPGSTPITVNSASVNAANKTITLALSRPVDNGEQVSVSYTKPTSGNVVQDTAGNDAADFTDQSVNSETPDTTPLALITTGTSAPKVNGTQLVLSYSGANSLDPAALTGNAGFTVTSTSPGSTPITVDSASVNAANKTITLTLSRPVDNGEQVSVSYTKPTSGNVVQDTAGNDAASFTGQAVNSETPDTTPPALITTGAAAPQVNGDQLVLSFSEANHLDDAHKPAPGDFTVSVDGQPNAVRTVAVDAAAKTVTLTLATPVANGQAVAVAYAAPTSGNAAIQDVAQNHAPGFPARAVDNHTPALSVPPTPVAPTPGASAQDSDKDGQPDTIEDRVPGLPGPDGAAPVIGDGNGDGIQDRMQSAVNSTHIAFSPTGASNPADAPATFVTLVGDSQDGKVSPDSDARITRLAQKDAPVLLPQGMQMPIGLLHFDATQTIADSSQPLSLSLYVDPAVLSVNGIWVQNGSTGVWTNLASAPYGGKMVMEGDRLRLDFHLPAGAHFDADGTPDGVVTVKAEVAVAHMPLSIVGQAPDAGHGGFWF
ncbi:hypothetical protein D5045_09050 [Verminephrobacter eiseniae]|uniref:SwmB domain-containing protein n=1 Tax=Verminephrobacter eiseniae TaxID=364317 RepID=UPI0022380B0A|nr:SwmB domain-containing protein [Verminephrobacter eiseniae]MCW5260366.1 hypothetical protein [Verminephrobacter eiseniae]